MSTALVKALRAKYPCAADAMRALDLPVGLLTGEKEDGLADKVMRILVRRYGSQRAALRRLGMDASSLLDEPEHMSGVRGGTGGEIEGGKPRTGGDRFGLRRSSRDNLPDKVETMPPQNTSSGEVRETLGGEDDDPDDDGLEAFRERMREHGLSEDQVEEACSLARDHMRRRGANGARDFIPKNRLKGGPGGRFGGPRDSQHASGESDVAASREYMRQIDEGDRRAVDQGPWEENRNGSMEQIIDHGLDARRRQGGRDRQAVDAIHRQLRRFGPEAGCRPMRPDEMGASDQVPTMAKRARTEARYPGLKRIGDASSDGELPPPADRIGGFA